MASFQGSGKKKDSYWQNLAAFRQPGWCKPRGMKLEDKNIFLNAKVLKTRPLIINSLIFTLLSSPESHYLNILNENVYSYKLILGLTTDENQTIFVD